jgi:ribonuclease BN (tRNA processing enzyme)
MSMHESGPLVTFLGTGTPLGLQGLHQACILIESRGQRILLDCGMTALTSLARAGVDPSEIDAVIISHLHGDHFGGLPLLLLDALRRTRSRPLTIAGPAATRQRVQQALEVFGWTSAAINAATFVHLQPGVSARIGGCDVTAVEVEHDANTAPTGLRIATDRAVIGYSGDAGWSDALAEIAHGADLFICAVWSFDTPDTTFIDLKTLLEKRERLDCQRIILTHLGPTMLAHLKEVPLEVAGDGMIIQL